MSFFRSISPDLGQKHPPSEPYARQRVADQCTRSAQHQTQPELMNAQRQSMTTFSGGQSSTDLTLNGRRMG